MLFHKNAQIRLTDIHQHLIQSEYLVNLHSLIESQSIDSPIITHTLIFNKTSFQSIVNIPKLKASSDGHPSVWLSAIPVVFLLAVLIMIMVFMGNDAISDYSHISLLISAMLAVTLALVSGCLQPTKLIGGFKRSATQILPAVPLLLLIALISTTWMLSGVVPTLIDYGLQLLNPRFFLVTTCAVCALVSVLTGSSWTTIATIGVAFIGIGSLMGYNEAWIAGAIISGAYFGDKVSPLSDTTVIASSSCGVDLFDHIRYLMLTAVPAMTIALLSFLLMGFYLDPESSANSTGEIISALRANFDISLLTLIIPLVTGILIALKVKTLYTLLVGSAMGIAGIFIFQPSIAAELTGGASAGIGERIVSTLSILWSETNLHTGNETLDAFVSTGGITGMLPTVMLVICAMLFGGAMIGTGMLRVIARAVTSRLRRRTSIVASTVTGGLFLNSCTADQYLSLIIGGNMFGDVYARNNLEPRLLSRTLEDSVSVTSVLIPWNSCGVTQATVLGVATLSYLPFCIFNVLSPLMSLFMAWIGFRVKDVSLSTQDAPAQSGLKSSAR